LQIMMYEEILKAIDKSVCYTDTINMNSNKEQLKDNYNRVSSRRRVGNTKGNIWKTNRRNRSI
jgi:hypothetical protein